MFEGPGGSSQSSCKVSGRRVVVYHDTSVRNASLGTRPSLCIFPSVLNLVRHQHARYPYDIFILMTLCPCPGLPPSLSSSRLYATSSPRLSSRRWEGVFYSVRSAFPSSSSTTLGTFPEEQDFSLKIAGVLSLLNSPSLEPSTFVFSQQPRPRPLRPSLMV